MALWALCNKCSHFDSSERMWKKDWKRGDIPLFLHWGPDKWCGSDSSFMSLGRDIESVGLNHFNTFSCRALQFWLIPHHSCMTSFALWLSWLSQRDGKRQRSLLFSPSALFVMVSFQPIYRRLQAEIFLFLFDTLLTYMISLHRWCLALGLQPEVS